MVACEYNNTCQYHFFSKLKGTLLQIWKSSYMFVFMRKWNPEKFALLFLRILELYIRKVCEMFIYKRTETIEYVKNYLLFKKNTNFTGK